jgi:RNA polymerase sigma-70 factor, ECF subfamily
VTAATLQEDEGGRSVESGGEERTLVRRMRAGQEQAFEAFFASYFPPLYRFALRRLGGDADLAEEVSQHALCIAVDRIATWRGEARLLTWMCAICRNEIAAHFRRFRREPARLELVEEIPEVRAALETVAGDGLDPEQRALRRETAELVHVALDHLPPQWARVLEWKYLEEASVKEIAVRLSATPKAVESLLTRARNGYREMLAALFAGVAAGDSEGGTHG